jgi:CRP-like cAMP-binding protein
VLQAFDLPARPSNEERTTIDDRCFADRVQFIINETGSERQSLIDALIRDLVSSTDILAIENAGRKLKDAKVLALGIWRRLIKEERERQRQLQYVTRQTRDRDERKRRLQELINVECSLEIIHEVLSQTTSSPYSHDVIELALATSVSHLLSDEVLLWLLIVGPPSSDKTQTALSIKDAAQVFHIDTLTENAFISGFVSPDGRSTQDLLAALDGYCLTIKDLNSLFGQHPEKVAKILGDLTAIYDGAFAKWTGTRGNVSYNARFSIIGCVTPMTLGQHHRYMSMVGARFLSYRISELNAEDVEEGFDTIWKNHKESKSRLRQLASAYATQLHHQIVQDGLSLPSFSEQAICELNSMARFLAYARAAVRTQRTDSITKIGKTVSRYDIVEVQREEPFRALQQLRVLAMALALIHRRNEVTSHELELCRRVVLSSMPYDRSLILSLFRDPNSLIAGDGGLTRKAAAKGLGVARNQVVRLLTELEFIGVLKGEKSGNKWQENEVWTYFPTSKEFLSILSKPTPPLDHNRDLKKTFLALA